MKKLIIILLLFAPALVGSASIFINSFNSGQLGPDMKYRYDLEKTAMGSEELENILIRPQGMAYKRPGTEYIETRLVVAPIPAIPPAAFRSEAYFTAHDDGVSFFDPNWNYLYDVSLPNKGVYAATIDQTDDGLVSVVGYATQGGAGAAAIGRIDAELNFDGNFYQPAAGWNVNEVVTGIRFGWDETYLYATTSYGIRILKFNAATGSEIFDIVVSGQDPYLLTIDENDNLYCFVNTGSWTVNKYDKDGNLLLSADSITSGYDGIYDLNNSVYGAVVLLMGLGLNFGGAPQKPISIVNPDTLAILDYYSDTGTATAGIKKDNYYYVTKGPGADGYRVLKLDESLNLIAGTSEALGTRIVEDWNGNIAVCAIGVLGSTIYILDTDLNLLETILWPGRVVTFGKIPEMRRINYLDAGTPGVPGIPGIGDRNPIRLIPFEYSVSDAYVLEFGHEYLSFLRTTP